MDRVKVRLIGADKHCIKYDTVRPVPTTITFPIQGEITEYITYSYRFAIIKGGKSPIIEEVVYVQDEPKRLEPV